MAKFIAFFIIDSYFEYTVIFFSFFFTRCWSNKQSSVVKKKTSLYKI